MQLLLKLKSKSFDFFLLDPVTYPLSCVMDEASIKITKTRFEFCIYYVFCIFTFKNEVFIYWLMSKVTNGKQLQNSKVKIFHLQVAYFHHFCWNVQICSILVLHHCVVCTYWSQIFFFQSTSWSSWLWEYEQRSNNGKRLW